MMAFEWVALDIETVSIPSPCGFDAVNGPVLIKAGKGA
jgi:hypothetical protein